MLDYQEQAAKEMELVYAPEVNLSKCIDKSREAVKDKTFSDAIFTLATLCRSPEVSRLREQVEELFKESPLPQLFSEVLVNKKGKVVAPKPPRMLDDSQEQEESI